MPLAIFRKHKEKLNLLMPKETKFGSKFIMVDQLLHVKTTLQQSIIGSQWVRYVTGLRETCTVRACSISRKVKDIVLNEHFWEYYTNF
jgi:hypothetical protein